MARSSKSKRVTQTPVIPRTLHIYSDNPQTSNFTVTDSDKRTLLYTSTGSLIGRDKKVYRSSSPIDTSDPGFNSATAPVDLVGTIEYEFLHQKTSTMKFSLDLKIRNPKAVQSLGFSGKAYGEMTVIRDDFISYEFNSSGLGYLTWKPLHPSETDLLCFTEWGDWVAKLFYTKAYTEGKQGRIEIWNRKLPPYLLDEVVLSGLAMMEKDSVRTVTIGNMRKRLGIPPSP